MQHQQYTIEPDLYMRSPLGYGTEVPWSCAREPKASSNFSQHEVPGHNSPTRSLRKSATNHMPSNTNNTSLMMEGRSWNGHPADDQHHFVAAPISLPKKHILTPKRWSSMFWRTGGGHGNHTSGQKASSQPNSPVGKASRSRKVSLASRNPFAHHAHEATQAPPPSPQQISLPLSVSADPESALVTAVFGSPPCTPSRRERMVIPLRQSTAPVTFDPRAPFANQYPYDAYDRPFHGFPSNMESSEHVEELQNCPEEGECLGSPTSAHRSLSGYQVPFPRFRSSGNLGKLARSKFPVVTPRERSSSAVTLPRHNHTPLSTHHTKLSACTTPRANSITSEQHDTSPTLTDDDDADSMLAQTSNSIGMPDEGQGGQIAGVPIEIGPFGHSRALPGAPRIVKKRSLGDSGQRPDALCVDEDDELLQQLQSLLEHKAKHGQQTRLLGWRRQARSEPRKAAAMHARSWKPPPNPNAVTGFTTSNSAGRDLSDAMHIAVGELDLASSIDSSEHMGPETVYPCESDTDDPIIDGMDGLDSEREPAVIRTAWRSRLDSCASHVRRIRRPETRSDREGPLSEVPSLRNGAARSNRRSGSQKRPLNSMSKSSSCDRGKTARSSSSSSGNQVKPSAKLYRRPLQLLQQ